MKIEDINNIDTEKLFYAHSNIMTNRLTSHIFYFENYLLEIDVSNNDYIFGLIIYDENINIKYGFSHNTINMVDNFVYKMEILLKSKKFDNYNIIPYTFRKYLRKRRITLLLNL